VVNAGKVELHQGNTPAGPWEEICEYRYALQWQTLGRAWRSIPADQLTGLGLAFEERDDHVDVHLRGEVKRPAGRFLLTSRYGVDLERREFLAEDRFQCDGLASSGVVRPMRLVQKVVLAKGHPDLAQPDEEEEAPPLVGDRLEKRVGSLRVGWGQHARRTGDMPGLEVDKRGGELSVLYHRDGVTEALDIDPYTVMSGAPSYGIAKRGLGRSANGDCALLYKDSTNHCLWLAYTEQQPPESSGDWAHVCLSGDDGTHQGVVSGKTYEAVYRMSLVLDERHSKIGVAACLREPGTNYGDTLSFTQCDIASGMSSVGTGSNWKKADGTTGYDSGLVSLYNGAWNALTVEFDNGDGHPMLFYRGSTAGTSLGFRKWNGLGWTPEVNIFSTTDLYPFGGEGCVDDSNVCHVIGFENQASSDSYRYSSGAFADAHQSGEWSPEVTILQDDAANAYDIGHACLCTDAVGSVHVAAGMDDSPFYRFYNWRSGGAWQHGTGQPSGLERTTGQRTQLEMPAGSAADGTVYVIHSYWWGGKRAYSPDDFNALTEVEPLSDCYSLEFRQHSEAANLYYLTLEKGDVYFGTLPTSSGSPWWAAKKLCTGGGGTFLSNNQNAVNGAMVGARPSGASCRCRVCEEAAAKDQSNPAIDSMCLQVGGSNLSSDVTTEYPAGQCPWDGEDKCNDPSVVPY